LCVLPPVPTTVCVGTCRGMSKTGLSLPAINKKKKKHHQVVGGGREARHATGDVLRAKADTVYAKHVHRMGGIVKRGESYVT
uniref:Uncharacterized protein n=1 Tax=Anopheles atroparvus TaxID=41427 RepID=A0AAG5CUS4_ANOAO